MYNLQIFHTLVQVYTYVSAYVDVCVYLKMSQVPRTPHLPQWYGAPPLPPKPPTCTFGAVGRHSLSVAHY